MESKKNNSLVGALVFVIIVLLGLVGYLGYNLYAKKDLSNNEVNTNEPANNNVHEESNEAEKISSVTLNQNEIKNYEALIASTKNSTVYTKNKIIASNLSDEQKMLNTIKYMLSSGEIDYNTYINADIIRKKAENIYGIQITNLPQTLTSKNSQVKSDFYFNR